MISLFSKKFLYFPGCLTTSMLPNIVENYAKIFHRLKLDFSIMNEKMCCGAVAYNNGYEKDFEALKERNIPLFKQDKIKSIVTNSGECLKTLALHYGVRAQHVSQILVKYVNKFPVKYEEDISVYDSPLLPVYDEPRQILVSLGFEVIDLEKNRENSIICGAEGGMIQNVPQIANNVSKFVFDMCKTKKLVVSDPLAFYHLKMNAPSNIKVFELSEVIV